MLFLVSAMSFPIVHKAHNPCPVCHRESGKCKQSGDGLLICRQAGRFEGEEVNGFVYGGPCRNDAFHKWFAVNRDGGMRRSRRDYTPSEPSPAKPPKREVPEFPGVYSGRLGGAYVFDYDEIVRKSRDMKPPQQEAMATELGLPPWAHLCMPWQFTFDREGQPCWTTPEYGLVDDQVVVVSRHLRYTPEARLSGKRTYGNPHLPEGTPRRGVFLPTDWHGEPGPLLAVEGASGAWAARVMSCCSIGRPACGAVGTDTIAHLYREHFPQADREVWVVGDNDENLAGEKGGRKAAVNLANLLERPVSLVRIAGSVKDTRDWFIRYSPHFDLDTLREKYFESLELVEVVQPGEKNEPARVDAKAVLITAAIAGTCQFDYTKEFTDEVLESLFGDTDWDEEISQAGKDEQYHEYDTPENPCERPRFIGMENEHNWDQAEMGKRCQGCCNCKKAKIERHLRLIRAQCGMVLRDGGLLYERLITEQGRAAFRQAFKNSTHPGKHYRMFRIPGTDQRYIITNVPTLGAPICPCFSDPMEVIDTVLEEVRPYVEAEVEIKGARLSSSDDGWKKTSLPKEPPKGWRCVTIHEDNPCREERDRINESIGCIEKTVHTNPDEDIISFRIYSMPGGWTAEAKERFQRMRAFGSYINEVEFTFAPAPPARDTYLEEESIYSDTFA